jgi:hypothetical protein
MTASTQRHLPIGAREIPNESALLVGQPAPSSNSAACVVTTLRQGANILLSPLEPYGVPLMVNRSARCLRRTFTMLLAMVVA